MAYRQRFFSRILELSFCENWQDAKDEWEYLYSDEIHGSECICGHPITEVCTVHNKFTGHTVEVGNCCVKKFMADTSLAGRANRDFKIIKGIQRNPIYSIQDSTFLIECVSDGTISENSYRFYRDINRKRKLSPQQYKWKYDINLAILNKINRR